MKLSERTQGDTLLSEFDNNNFRDGGYQEFPRLRAALGLTKAVLNKEEGVDSWLDKNFYDKLEESQNELKPKKE